MKSSELLKVYKTRDEAYEHLPEYAKDLKQWGITANYGVYAAPVQKNRPLGYWGIYLRNRKVKS